MLKYPSLLASLLMLMLWSQNSFAFGFKIAPIEKSFVKYGNAKSRGLNPKKFNVVVWNILKAKKKDFRKEFASFRPHPDIFMLQEVNIVPDFFNAFRYYPQHEIHFGSSFYRKKRGKEIHSGTAISSRFNPEDSGMIRTRELEPIVKTPKVVTWMKIPFEGVNKSLLLVNIHGLNMTKNRDFFKQMDSCARLIAKHDGPVIFAGDFNTSDMEKYNKMNQVALDLNLVPVAFLNDKRKKSKFSRLVIDHIFVRGMHVTNALVHNELKSSDHKAMSISAKLY